MYQIYNIKFKGGVCVKLAKNIKLKPYLIRLNPQVIQGLNELAKMKDTTKSQLIRDAAYKYLVSDYRKEMQQDQLFKDTMPSIRDAFRGL
jgi:predicted DNA-binding protein